MIRGVRISDTRITEEAPMSTMDYLINAGFVAMVVMQARERRLDRRALVIPLVLVFFVAQQYLHAIPTTGSDVILIGLLASAGLALGLLSGFATRVRPGSDGVALARVGWIAGSLLVAGICSRMVFAFVVTHGGEGAIRGFSITHQISAGAWPVALVLMAICEVTVRVVTVQLRGRQVQAVMTPSAVAVASAA
jgi:hypothetical protein